MPAVGAAFAAIFAAGGLGATLAKLALGLLLNFAVAKLSAPKGPTPQEVQTEIRQSNAPRMRHYGRVRVAGVVMFWDWVAEETGRWLYKLLAVSTGGVDGFSAFWLNETRVDFNGASVATEPWGSAVEIRVRLGRDGWLHGGSHQILADAFPANWIIGTGTEPAHRLTGVATVLARFQAVDGADISDVYPGGEPKVTSLVRGARVHDPRGGGAAAWSENIPLQILDILTNSEYGRLTLDDVDLPSFIAAADDADDAIPLKDGGTLPRYFGGGSYKLNEPLKDVLRRMLEGCAGSLFRTGDGKIGLRVGKWREPTYTIEEDHIVSIEGGAGHGEFDRVTTLVPRYVAPETEYQETTADAWEDLNQLALIGEAEPREFNLPWVQHHGQARRLAKIKMAKLNPKFRFTVQLRFWGLLLLEEEAVYLNFPKRGIINEPFWIDSFSFDPAGEEAVCTVRLVHADPTSFDWNAVLEEGDPPEVPGEIGSGGGAVPEPEITSVEVVQVNGRPVIRARATPRSGYVLTGGYRQVGASEWVPVAVDTSSGIMETPQISNGQPHEIRMGFADSALIGATVSYTSVSDIEVVVTSEPPNAPVIVSAVQHPSQVEIVFRPDLGANYSHSRIYRGATFETASRVGAAIHTKAEEITVLSSLETGVNYYVQSESYAGETSPPVLAITTT